MQQFFSSSPNLLSDYNFQFSYNFGCKHQLDSPHGIVVKGLDNNINKSEFKLQFKRSLNPQKLMCHLTKKSTCSHKNIINFWR